MKKEENLSRIFYLPDESQINKHHNKNDDDHHHRSETAERSPEGISHDLNLLIFMLVKYVKGDV